MRGSRFLLLLLLSYSCNCLVIRSLDDLSHVDSARFHVPDVQTGEQKVRFLYLSTACGNQNDRFVEAINRRVTANGLHKDSRTLLRQELHGGGSHVSLQNNQTRKYICFNTKGRLVARNQMGRRHMCEFRQILTENHHTEYQSLYNNSWYIQFRCNRSHRPVAQGTKNQRDQDPRERQFMIHNKHRGTGAHHVPRHGISYNENSPNSEFEELDLRRHLGNT